MFAVFCIVKSLLSCKFKCIKPWNYYADSLPMKLTFSNGYSIRTVGTVSKHLARGSKPPPKTEGLMRLFSMEYCPYAHRVRLILRAKNIDHQIVNLNLLSKPKWFFEINPDGTVPALEIGDKVLVESLDICDYLDKEYRNPPMYSSDPAMLKKEKALIEKIGPMSNIFMRMVFGIERTCPSEWKNELEPYLKVFDDGLKDRGTKYFCGDNPGMVDYMLWPWAERAGATVLVLGEQIPLEPDEFATLRTWRKVMRQHPLAEELYTGPVKFYKCVLMKLNIIPPDYDNI